MALNIDLLRTTFNKLAERADDFAVKFYENLFGDYPAAKPLFENVDMDSQRVALINQLVFVVKNLDNEAALVKSLRKLGERHLAYGTENDHYELVGLTLIKTMEEFLGSDFTDEVKGQWIEAYNFIAKTMIDAADDLKSAAETSEFSTSEEAPAPVAEATPQEQTPQAKVVPLHPVAGVELPGEVVAQIRSQAKKDVQEAIKACYEQALAEEIANQASEEVVGELLRKKA